MESSNEYSTNSLEKEMQRLAEIVVDKGYETEYCVHGLNESPTFLEMLQKHVNVTHQDRPYPMFPVRLTGAVCGMYRSGALFVSFDIEEHGGRLTMDEVRLTLRDDNDQLVHHYIKLKDPKEIPGIQKAKEMMIAKYKYLKRRYKRSMKMK